MTCVLSVTPFHTNPFSEDTSVELKTKECDNFDFDWINAQYIHTGLSNDHRCTTRCRLEASTGSSIPCRAEIPSCQSATMRPEQRDLRHEDHDTDLYSTDTGKSIPLNGRQGAKLLFEVCAKTNVEHSLQQAASHGFKRKAGRTDREDGYSPPKRVSPFLNTPKERKDERKKILKISLKKLKQLDDPEAFLRRTVLVNNTMKRLQIELRSEKFRSKHFKSFNGNGVLHNNCLSDSYLFDDPFLSGVHEKITDDMTDTLIRNVFHEKQNDTSKEDDGVEALNNDMEMSDTKPNVDLSLSNTSCVSEYNLNKIYVEDEPSAIESSKKCDILTRLCNRSDLLVIHGDKCDELERARRCDENNCVDNARNNCETVHLFGNDVEYKEMPSCS